MPKPPDKKCECGALLFLSASSLVCSDSTCRTKIRGALSKFERKLFVTHWPDRVVGELSEVLPDIVPCPTCKGTGEVNCGCDDGEQDCPHCGQAMDCEECDGTCRVECENCFGDGYVEAETCTQPVK